MYYPWLVDPVAIQNPSRRTIPGFISYLQNFKGTVVHVETRPAPRKGVSFDVLLKVDITREPLLTLLKSLRQSSAITSVTLLSEHHSSIKGRTDREDTTLERVGRKNESERKRNRRKNKRWKRGQRHCMCLNKRYFPLTLSQIHYPIPIR